MILFLHHLLIFTVEVSKWLALPSEQRFLGLLLCLRSRLCAPWKIRSKMASKEIFIFIFFNGKLQAWSLIEASIKGSRMTNRILIVVKSLPLTLTRAYFSDWGFIDRPWRWFARILVWIELLHWHFLLCSARKEICRLFWWWQSDRVRQHGSYCGSVGWIVLYTE